MSLEAWIPLLRTCVEGGLLLGAIAILTRVWPAMPAGTRAALWWLGSLRMVAGLLPLDRLARVTPGGEPLALVQVPVTPGVQDVVAAAARPMTAAPAAPLELLAIAVLVVWVAGVLYGLLRIARGLALLRRWWREAEPFRDPRVAAWQDVWAMVLGRERLPEIRVSASVAAPLTVGVWRSGVLLPAGSERLSDDALRLVLAHELGHVRRRDPLLALVPVLSRLLFWFHPLVRIADREYLAAREEACDAEALRVTGAAPREYGSLLVDYGVGAPVVPGSAAWTALNARQLKRRILMLSRSLSIPASHRVLGAALVMVFTLLAVTPVRLLAMREDEGTPTGGRFKTRFSYLIFTAGEKYTQGAIDQADMDRARHLQDLDEDVIYFRIGSDAWVCRDPGFRAQVRAALADQERFEAKRLPIERKRQRINEEYEPLMRRYDALQKQRMALDVRRDELQSRRAAGERARDLVQERIEVETEIEAVEDEMQDLQQTLEGLNLRLQALYKTDKVDFEIRDRIHHEALVKIERLARQAIRDGSAESLDD